MIMIAQRARALNLKIDPALKPSRACPTVGIMMVTVGVTVAAAAWRHWRRQQPDSVRAGAVTALSRGSSFCCRSLEELEREVAATVYFWKLLDKVALRRLGVCTGIKSHRDCSGGTTVTAAAAFKFVGGPARAASVLVP
jgi:hypothetical protein